MSDALVLFMPSGRRGRFALGTPLLVESFDASDLNLPSID